MVWLDLTWRDSDCDWDDDYVDDSDVDCDVDCGVDSDDYDDDDGDDDDSCSPSCSNPSLYSLSKSRAGLGQGMCPQWVSDPSGQLKQCGSNFPRNLIRVSSWG